MLIKVAWRNIWRNKTRSLVIIAAVGIGLWSALFIMSFYGGLIEQRISSAIETEISHIQIHHPLFTEDYDIQYYIPEAQSILARITKMPQVKAAAGRVILKGMISTASGSSGIQINGILPEEENRVTRLKSKLVAGSYFPGTRANEMLISEKNLKKLRLKLNGKAILTFQDKDGNLASGAFRIAGIFKTVSLPYDENNVFVTARTVDTLAGIPRQYNEIALLLASGDLVDVFRQRLQKDYPLTEVKTWMEISPEMDLLVSASEQAILIYMSIIMLALAFGIINTMLMAVLERTREIGMLLALGMSKPRVFAMILMETVFLVATGSPMGVLLGGATIAYLHKAGIHLKQFSEAYSSLGYSSIVYPTIRLQQVGMLLAMMVATAVVASLLPAQRAMKLKPAEAIRR